MVFYLSQGIQTGRQADGWCIWSCVITQLLCRAQPAQAQLSASSGQMQGPYPLPTGSPEAGAGSDGDCHCHCHGDFKIRWSHTQATHPDFLSRECFRHCHQLLVSKQLLSITSLPSRRVGSQIPGFRLLLESLPIAHLASEPPHCPPCPMGISPPHCPVPPWAGTPCRLSCGAVVPRACPQPKGLPSLSLHPQASSASQAQESGLLALGNATPKCHGMQASMKTRGLGHVFLFVCMCQRFQWLRNVCL